MKVPTEIEIKVSGVRIIEAKLLDDQSCKLVVEVPELNADEFVLVEASKLSIMDEFMQHTTKTVNEQELKTLLIAEIKKGAKDFWRPQCDPSFNKSRTGICYKPGRKPAVGKSYEWWERTAKEFCPAHRSRLGTKGEYVLFLGVLLKNMVAEGWPVERAWSAVCNDSGEIGHYKDAANAKHRFEVTGSRECCGFFDLANTVKLLAEDVEKQVFWQASGLYAYEGCYCPLADLFRDENFKVKNRDAVGWIVLE